MPRRGTSVAMHRAQHVATTLPHRVSRAWSRLAGLAAIGVAASWRCGESYSGDGAGAAPDGGSGTPECASFNECPTGWTCSELGTCLPPPELPGDGGVPPPPEVEYELGAPVSSLRYVYVAMTAQDALARIDGATLEVDSLHVGEQPEVVTAAPGSDTAVVLDAINGVATIVRPVAEANQEIDLLTLPNLNRVDIDPPASMPWPDSISRRPRDHGGLDGVERIGSFQDVTVLRLPPAEPVAVDLTVGFRLRAVAFDQSGARACVITEDGVSVIDLAAVLDSRPTIVAPIAVSADPFADPARMEVAVIPMGERAVVREAERADLRIVTLTGALGRVSFLPIMGGPVRTVTRFDLSSRIID